MDSLARMLLPTIQQLFEKNETKQEFEKWLAERQNLQFNNSNDKTENPIETKGMPQNDT